MLRRHPARTPKTQQDESQREQRSEVRAGLGPAMAQRHSSAHEPMRHPACEIDQSSDQASWRQDAQRNDRDPRRLRQRPDHTCRRRADLSDGRLCVRQRRPRGRAVQPRGRGLPLQPDQQSDRRRCSNGGSRTSRAGTTPWRSRRARRRCTTPSSTLADCGGNIVSVPQLYGTTHTLLRACAAASGYPLPVRAERQGRGHRSA